VAAVVLKIYRKRAGSIEEIVSRDITNVISKSGSIYSFNWKPGSIEVKAGDELQAKIRLSYKPSLARQKIKTQNKTPYADAGNTVELELPITKPIVLNGTRSRDEDGKIVSVQWKQIAGPTNLTILKKDSLTAFANGQFNVGIYAFELSIRDNAGASAIGRTIVRIKPAPFVTNSSPIKVAPKIDSTNIRKPQVVSQASVAGKTVEKLKGGPSNAALNVLLPGLGHYFVSGNYKGENRKFTSFIITGVYAASLGGAFYFNSKSEEQYKKYNQLAEYREYQKDANGVVIGMRGANESEANKYLNTAESAHTNSLICLGVSGAVMIGDVIYTFIRGTTNKKEWQNSSTSFKPKLFISSDGTQTTAGVQIKF